MHLRPRQVPIDPAVGRRIISDTTGTASDSSTESSPAVAKDRITTWPVNDYGGAYGPFFMPDAYPGQVPPVEVMDGKIVVAVEKKCDLYGIDNTGRTSGTPRRPVDTLRLQPRRSSANEMMPVSLENQSTMYRMPATKPAHSIGIERLTTRLAPLGAVMALGVVALFPAGAAAETSQTSTSEDWQFGAIVYGYFPSFGGSSSFPSEGTSIDVSADKIISAIKFAFMGAFEAQKGPFGGFTDVMYLNLGGSKSATRDLAIGGAQLPAGTTADASLDIEGWVWTLAVNYRALSTPRATFDTFAGARLLSLKEKLNWAFSGNVGPFVGPGRVGSNQQSLENWDGILGFKGRLNLGHAGRGWFVPYYLDVGTGASHFTWQGIAGIGYGFGWGELTGVWRHLAYDFKSGKTIESVSLDGPAVAVAFRW